MFPADAELQVGARLAATLLGDRDKLAHTFDIQADERVLGIDALFDIGRQEPACVIARDAKRGLGQVVGAEAEERAHFCDLARHQRGARKLDHRTDRSAERRVGKEGVSTFRSRWSPYHKNKQTYNTLTAYDRGIKL